MIKVKSLIILYTVINNKLNILLDNNSIIEIDCDNEIEVLNNKYLNKLGIKNIELEQCNTFSKKENETLYLNVLYTGIVNYDLVKESKLKPNSNIDITNKYIAKSLDYIKKNIIRLSVIKKIYSEFSLPELQKLYEDLFDVKLDRRNFRKHLIKLDVIEPLSKNTSIGKGRPATLYKFKNINKDIIIF